MAALTSVGHGGVEHAHMAQGVLLAALPGVVALGRKHVPVVLGDQQGLRHVGRDLVLFPAAGVVALVRKIVVGVHVLEQAALFEIAHAGGRTARIELVRQGVGARVEGVVVLALVDPHAPEHDRGMVAVLRHHLAHVLHGLVDPLLVADMLPAGDLGKDQQTAAVALVDEEAALRIVGGAHGGELQLLGEDARVLALQAFGRGVADIGPALMAVEPAHKIGPSV